MKHKRAVTEADFRSPEFRTAVVEDYEFNTEGKPVRKDRWETGIRLILDIVGVSTRQGFEVSQVVDAVRLLANERDSWETEDYPALPAVLDLRLKDGSVLLGGTATRTGPSYHVTWNCLSLAFDVSFVVGWRISAPVATPNE